MFEAYEVDFSKVNVHWCGSVCIMLDEIHYLLTVPDYAWLYLREGGLYEVVGYSNYNKFVAVTFTLKDQTLTIETVNLARYASIRDVVLRQFLEEAD